MASHSCCEEPHGHGHGLLEGQVPVKIFCKADKTFNLAIRNNAPVMAPADSHDPTQLWIKDQSYGARTKDSYGSPAFVLINKATHQALKHGKEKGHQLHLVDYRPEEVIFPSLRQDVSQGQGRDTACSRHLARAGQPTLEALPPLNRSIKNGIHHLQGGVPQ
ncbi:hypothetical protein L7F22_067672 [Adiantum nelumboides]|nr:hypothetical protein [Adiantum nelumboides]